MGASGYIGGELVRLLLGHPRVNLVQATSNKLKGRPLHQVNPNLRGRTGLTFTPHDEISPCDVLFLALPHGVSGPIIADLAPLAPRIIDLSADFRLKDLEEFQRYYGGPHPHPEWVDRFTPGIPELHRKELRHATHVAVPGCMANAGILGLYPVAAAGLVEGEVLVDGRTGSSGSGTKTTRAGQHAERSGVMRVFKPLDHRHQAEISQACGIRARMSATGFEAVRGLQVVCQMALSRPTDDKELWAAYRGCYGSEPFVRIIRQRGGLYPLPEPKILSGTNYCDVGFVLSDDGRRLTVIAALDNLGKGGAGNAVQCLNIMAGWGEDEGLEFPGLHPI